MNIPSWYAAHFEGRLTGRYVTLKHISPVLDSLPNLFEVSVLGHSEKGKKIHSVKFGRGKKVILAWSQMHGNESTTTKALFDFFKFLGQTKHFKDEIVTFLETYTCYVVPILNPDGATLYTRENANGVDLNRDAQEESQVESRILKSIFTTVNPHLCLNLHDQRTIYSLPEGKSATVSFLAPAADAARSITEARKVAMQHIERMFAYLSTKLPGQIGRYDDTFNANCVGDTFQQQGVPTILFEAGHFPGDYQREKTREFIFYALLNLFEVHPHPTSNARIAYMDIPENQKRYKDVIIRNVIVGSKSTDVAIQFEEKLVGENIKFIPILDKIGDLASFFGHLEIEGEGVEILLNSYENVFEGEKIARIIDKNSDKVLFP